jgi:hypothetical protein
MNAAVGVTEAAFDRNTLISIEIAVMEGDAASEG